MHSGFRSSALLAMIAAASLIIHADQLPSQSADIQLRLGRLLFDQGQYPEALLYGLMRLQDKIRKEGTVLRKERVIMSGDTEPTLIGERA